MSTSGELFCLLLFALLAFSHAYQKYAKSLKLPKPFNDNVYKFELNVTRQMTMTRKRKNDKVELVDYNPNTQTWTARDQSLPQGYRVLNESDLDSVSVGDGLHKLKVFINGQTPGPTLVVPLNATVIIKVRNQQAAEQMTFHVHGIKKQDRWFADGVPFVQQCPVLASTTYTYKFIADTPGTHWYHGHVGLDQLEGLLGAFVVIDPNEPKVDHDYVALLDDEPVRPTPENRYLDHNNLEKSYNGVDEEFKPYECRANHDGAHTGNCIPTETITVNGIGWHEQNHETKNVPHVIFRTSESEKTRIRFINGGRYNALQVTISSHVLTVTAVDGVQIEPVKVSKMIIYPGERYDVVLYKNHCPYPGQQSGYIQIETLDATGQSVTQISKLEYKDVLRKSYCDFHTHWLFILNCPFLKQTDSYYEQCVLPTHLRPIQETDSEVVQKKFFESGFEEHFYNCASRNGFSYKYPTSIPYFHQANMSYASRVCDPSCPARQTNDPKGENCKCFNYYKFTLNNTVQMTFYNMDGSGDYTKESAHPMHMHGLHFYVMKIGYPEYNEKGHIRHSNRDIPCGPETAPCSNLSFTDPSWALGNVPGMVEHPPLRDTIVVPAGGYVVIRFRATNPGWWLSHCHAKYHAANGLMFAYRIGENHEIPSPPDGFPKDCGNYEPEEPF